MTIASIEATLSADWQKFITFIQQEETKLANFLVQVSQGEQVLATDIEQAAQAALGKLSTVNNLISIVSGAAAVIAPGSAPVTATISALTKAASEVGALVNAVAAGQAPSGSDAIVTDTVAGVNALSSLSALTSQAATTIGQLAAQSPAAAQTVSPPTPNEG